MGLYLRPGNLAEALAALADPKLSTSEVREDRLTVLAGGTDFYPAQTARRAWLERSPQNVLDITGIDELKGIRRIDGGTTFGALATWTEICDAALPPAFASSWLAPASRMGCRLARQTGGG